jgi:hypothetical protein
MIAFPRGRLLDFRPAQVAGNPGDGQAAAERLQTLARNGLKSRIAKPQEWGKTQVAKR